MPNELRNILYALVVCSILVVLCYFYVDKPVAILVYDDHFSNIIELKWFTYLAALIGSSLVLIYLYYVVRFYYGEIHYFDRVLLAVANSVIIATLFKTLFKTLFGRYWPKTWIHNNPSLIRDHAYGFHFMRGGDAYGAFPSGHTAVIVAAMTVLWLTYPRGRIYYLLAVLLVVIGLIGMDYHFVSDVIAGGFLGAVVAYFVTRTSGLKKR